MSLYLGCIADDFTGATDLANILVGEGMRTTLCVGIPVGEVPESEAIVVALKSRTIPAEEAVAQSLAALKWLQEAGAQQVFFKYCSTFDSTDEGNIGPVAEALLEKLGGELAIACPAFPEIGQWAAGLSRFCHRRARNLWITPSLPAPKRPSGRPRRASPPRASPLRRASS